ncbi:hypothetical protein MY5147_008956 [Beauveria neobassiana]
MSEFHWNGHITLTSDDVDESHPLHALWEEAHRNLDQLFRQSDTDAGRTLDMERMKEVYLYIWARCHEAASVYYARGDYKAHLPTRGEVLSLRFALPPHQANGHVTYALNMLAACHALHLFQVGDQDWRARAEASEAAESLKDASDFARMFEANRELSQVIDQNLALWAKNKEDIELCLNKLKTKTSTTGSEQTSEELHARAEYEDIKLPAQKDLPSHAPLLAVRFASQDERSNSNIVSLLAALNWLYLWHIPPHFVTRAKMPETNDDEKDLSTERAPIKEGDTNLEMALSIGITDVDRKLEAIQHARKDLEDRLAVMKDAEATVLKARSAMGQVGNAMAMADNALLQSPMSILGRNQ